MNEFEARYIAEGTAAASLLAVLLAHDANADLERLLATLPVGLMTTPAVAAVPEHLQDVFRTHVRDYTRAVLQTAIDLRRQEG